MGQIRVGIPLYLNTLPFLFYFPKEDEKRFKIVLDVPKRLNQMLLEGNLEVSLSSSILYAKEYKNFFILPDLSISAVGKVKSVILYHKKPLEELEGEPIGITPETESSLYLLRILLEDFLKIFPEYVFLSSPWKKLKKGERESLGGYLAIGDEALLLQQKNKSFFITDLAELWLKHTGFPFVFALFMVKKDLASLYEESLRELCMLLYYCKAKALSNLREIIDKTHVKLPKEYAYRYLTHLEYDFSGLKQRAYLFFCDRLVKLGILKEVPILNFFEFR